MRYLLFAILIFALSCTEYSEKTSANESQKEVKEIPTINKLKGCWQEEKDTLHILKFTDSLMIEMYNGSEINSYAIKMFNGLPGEGGYEAVSGRVIQIEESKDNYHHFTIVILDQHYLELLHRSSGENKFYKKLNN